MDQQQNPSVNSMPPAPAQPQAPENTARPAINTGNNLGFNQPQAPMTPMSSNNKPSSGSRKGLIIFLALFFILIGGAVYAYFFTDWKYKIPGMSPDESELVNLMYDNLAELDGADFSIEYNLFVGDRDEDVNKDSNSRDAKKDQEVINELRTDLNSARSRINSECLDKGKNLEYRSGMSCDGTEEAKPKVGDSLCDGSSLSWPSLDKYDDWDFVGNCESDVTTKTWTYVVGNNYNKDVIKCSRYSCSLVRERDNLGLQRSGALEFISGSYFEEIFSYIEDQIPTNFATKISLSGKGFSATEISQEKQLPDLEAAISGEADLSSMSLKLDVAAKAVDDDFYYKVDNFPIVDITKGYMGKWIMLEPDNQYINRVVPEYNEKNKQVIENFRKFIKETKDYDVLEIMPLGEEMTIDDAPIKLFNVKVKAANVPDWLTRAKALAAESVDEKYSNLLRADKEEFTEIEKQNIVDYLEKKLKNLKITIGISSNTGDLSYIKMAARLIPPAESKKFADKQFNSILTIKIWNHNDPSKVNVPEDFVNYEVIEQAELDLDDETYNDYKQMQRITDVRIDLEEYYTEHGEFPDKLSAATRQYRDRNNKNEEYDYKSSGDNYSLKYYMINSTLPEDREEEEDEDLWGSGNDSGSGYDEWGMDRLGTVNLGTSYDREERYKRFSGIDYSLENYLYWHSGVNEADRFSPIADQHKKSHKFTKDDSHSDHDVYMTLKQVQVIQAVLNGLKYEKNTNKKYPKTLEVDEDEDNYTLSYYQRSYKNCYDYILNKKCEYRAVNDGEDFELKVNFLMSKEDITKTLSYSYLSDFESGLNTFDESSLSYNSLSRLSSAQESDNEQKERIVKLRKDLDKYYRINGQYPTVLDSSVSTEYMDVNTKNKYKYSSMGKNYSLKYYMNESALDNYGNVINSSNVSYQRFANWHSSFEPYLYWHKGENEADRFSFIVDQQKKTTKYTTDNNYSDYDVYIALAQSRVLKGVLDGLKIDKKRTGKFPDALRDDYTSGRCNDFSTGERCQYKVLDNGEDFELIVNFNMPFSKIVPGKMSGITYVVNFTEGINKYNNKSPEIIDDIATNNLESDTDKDGLSDDFEKIYGTNINLEDTDGDSYSDSDEFNRGYNPIGTGLGEQNNGWSACISADYYSSCDSYCKSIDKECTDTGITKGGYSNKGSQEFSSDTNCLFEYNMASEQHICSSTWSGYSGNYWRCYCK